MIKISTNDTNDQRHRLQITLYFFIVFFLISVSTFSLLLSQERQKDRNYQSSCRFRVIWNDLIRVILTKLDVPFFRKVFHLIGLKEIIDNPNHIPKQLPICIMYSIRLRNATADKDMCGCEGTIEAIPKSGDSNSSTVVLLNRV